MAIATINPATGEVVKTFEPLTEEQIDQKLQLAASAYREHRRTSFADRASKMLRAAEILEKEKDECAHLMTLEMGKPLKAAVAEALKCATGCRYYAENAEKFLADEIVGQFTALLNLLDEIGQLSINTGSANKVQLENNEKQ